MSATNSLPVPPQAFKGDFVTPTHAGYADALSRWALNARRNAAVVAFVKDAEDIALVIEYARTHKFPIAIRGGGHSVAGASSIKDGLVIDLSRYLNGCRIDAENHLAYVDGGAIWKTVDKAAIEHGLATVAGTVNDTGVGGLSLGGGYGWLSGEHGLVIDNIVQATVITADGSILTANESMNPDLFFGIRGGGSNFGVCSELVLRLHPQRRHVFAGQLVFPATTLEKLVSITRDRLANQRSEKEGMFQILTVSPDHKPCIVVWLFYNGTEEEGRANFKTVLDLGPIIDLTKEIPYEAVNALMNDILHPGQYSYWNGTAHRTPDYASAAKLMETVTQVASDSTITPFVLFEYIPLDKINAVPNTATAFRRDATSNVALVFLWKEDAAGNVELSRKTARMFYQMLGEGQSDLTTSEAAGYSNYDPDCLLENKVSHKAKLVFRENYTKLQEIKKKYDPKQIFSNWFPITPAGVREAS